MTSRPLVILPPRLRERLDAVCPHDSWDAVPSGSTGILSRTSHASVFAVVDPLWANGAAFCTTLLKTCSHPALLCYTRLTPASAKAMLALARLGEFVPVFSDVDDDRVHLADAIRQCQHASEVTSVLRSYTVELQRCPSALADAIRELFERPERFHAGRDVALLANMSPVSLYRHIASAGLPSAKQLLVGARLLSTRHQLTRAKVTIDEAAARSGYAYVRVFNADARRVLGVDASAFRAMADDDVRTRVVDWMKPHLVR